MKLASLVYRKYLDSKGSRKIIWSLVREAMIKLFRDPSCRLLIHDRYLNLALSDLQPEFLHNFRFYDQLPRRVSNYIHQEQGCLNCIDVGANIGDSIAAFYKEESDMFLAIEPAPKFKKLLIENWGWNSNVTVIDAVCSSFESEGNFCIEDNKGTASIMKTLNGVKMTIRSLDGIISEHPEFMKANVLKIDTDGHDFEVISGSRKLLSENFPAALFECDCFGNTNYVEDCLNTLELFKQTGYNNFLLYDNFGGLMGLYPLSDLWPCFLHYLWVTITCGTMFGIDKGC